MVTWLAFWSRVGSKAKFCKAFSCKSRGMMRFWSSNLIFNSLKLLISSWLFDCSTAVFKASSYADRNLRLETCARQMETVVARFLTAVGKIRPFKLVWSVLMPAFSKKVAALMASAALLLRDWIMVWKRRQSDNPQIQDCHSTEAWYLTLRLASKDWLKFLIWAFLKKSSAMDLRVESKLRVQGLGLRDQLSHLLKRIFGVLNPKPNSWSSSPVVSKPLLTTYLLQEHGCDNLQVLERDLLARLQVVPGRVSRFVRVEDVQDLVVFAILEEIRCYHLESQIVSEQWRRFKELNERFLLVELIGALEQEVNGGVFPRVSGCLTWGLKLQVQADQHESISTGEMRLLAIILHSLLVDGHSSDHLPRACFEFNSFKTSQEEVERRLARFVYLFQLIKQRILATKNKQK